MPSTPHLKPTPCSTGNSAGSLNDPYWGTSEHAYTDKYHWTDGQGNYQHSNEAGFNPNVGARINWMLIKAAQ